MDATTGQDTKWAKRQIAAATRKILVERWPLCFFPSGTDKKPLKVGILGDIVAAAPDLDPHHVDIALHDYAWGDRYLRGVEAGHDRVDLNGNSVGPVSVRDMKWASRVLRERRYISSLHTEIKNLKAQNAAVIAAVRRLYYAAHWSPDRPCDADALWTTLRDVCGFEPGGTEALRHEQDATGFAA